MNPSHLKSIVEPAMKGSLGIFVAGKEPCLAISHGPPASGRRAVRTTPDRLAEVELPKSFAFAVLLCEGDTTGTLAAFAVKHKVPFDRFHFYFTGSTDPVAALAPWRESGLEVYSVHHIRGWQELNKHFGAHWNNLVHDDYCPRPGCRLR